MLAATIAAACGGSSSPFATKPTESNAVAASTSSASSGSQSDSSNSRTVSVSIEYTTGDNFVGGSGWVYRIDATFPTPPLRFEKNVTHSQPGEADIMFNSLDKASLQVTALDTSGRQQPDFSLSSDDPQVFIPLSASAGSELTQAFGCRQEAMPSGAYSPPWPPGLPNRGLACVGEAATLNVQLSESQADALVSKLNAASEQNRMYFFLVDFTCTVVVQLDGSSMVANSPDRQKDGSCQVVS